jgi:hypothetical protein
LDGHGHLLPQRHGGVKDLLALRRIKKTETDVSFYFQLGLSYFWATKNNCEMACRGLGRKGVVVMRCVGVDAMYCGGRF